MNSFRTGGAQLILPGVQVIQPAVGEEITYLLRDTFATDLAAGAVNGTASEPVGTWTRQVTDAGSRVTITSAKLKFATGNSVYTDPRVYYTNSFARTPGRVLFMRGIEYDSGLVRFGFHSSQPPSAANAVSRFQPSGTSFAGADSAGYGNNVPIVLGTAYDACIVLRTAGALYFVKGGIYTDWRLINPAATSTTDPVYVGISNNTGVNTELDAFEMYDIAGYVDGYFSRYKDTTPADDDLALADSDGFVEITWTPASNEIFEIDFRRLDDNNRFILRCDQAAATIRIVTMDAGIETLGTTAAQTWTVGTPQRLMIKLDGLNADSYVGATAKNSVLTAINQSNRGVKVRDFATGSNLYTWAITGFGAGSAPVPLTTPTLTLVRPVDYRIYQRNGSDQANIPIAAVLPVFTAVEVEVRWQGGSWTSLGTFTGGWCEGQLSNQAAGQGLLEVRCNGQTASAAFVGIGDVLMAWGQSNASGRATNNQAYSHATLKAALYGNDYTWKELTDPTDSNTGALDSAGQDATAAGSVWPLLATEIMAVTGFPVAIVPANWGGTSIAQWAPGANHYLRTSLYGHMAYRVKKTGAGLLLGWLGETDATLGTSQALFNSGLDTFANAVNTDLGIKVMMCRFQRSSGAADAAEDLINAGIAEAWGDNANVLEGPTLTDLTSDDTYHLQTDAKLLTAAQRWATKIVAVL